MTLLRFSVEVGSAELVDILLSFPEVDVNKYFEINIFENEKITRNPLKMKNICTSIKCTPLSFAILNQNVEVVKSILKRNDLDLNLIHRTDILAVNYHSLIGDDGGGWILDGNEIIHNDKTYLQIANEKGKDEIVQLITKRTA